MHTVKWVLPGQGDQAREKNSTESFYLTAKEAKRAKKESVSEGF
jgi:hypothetical protein